MLAGKRLAGKRVTCMLVIGCLVIGSVALLGLAQEKPFEGIVLRFAAIADQWAPYLAVLGEEFEQITGARVEVDILGFPALHAAVTHDLAAGTQVYDLVVVDIIWSGLFAQKGWTVNLAPLIVRDYVEINVPDILPIMWYQGSWEGQQVAFPLGGYANWIVYRRDLFEDPAERAAFKERFGWELTPPRTLDEMRAVAEFFTRPEEGLFGLVANGARGAPIVHDWLEWSRMFGGEIIDAEDNVVVNSPENLAALKFFVEIHDRWAPPGSTGFWWADRETSFRMGESVMQSSWSVARWGYENPYISLVVGKTGTAASPMEPAVHPRVGFGGWGVGINNDIDELRQAAAWEFIKWITSPEIERRWMLQGEGKPIRLSSLLCPELNEEMPWLPTLLKLFIHGDGEYRPRIPEFPAIQAILGLRLNQAIIHELEPEEALRLAHEEIERLFD